MNSITTHQPTKLAYKPDSFEKGRIFEDYIVTLFNERKFILLDWRSDKRASNGVLPLSSSYPDLEFAYLGRKRNRFAVECKWRKQFIDGRIYWANDYQISRYQEYKNLNHNRIQIFIAIGVGGTPSNPEKLFLTPFEHICMYNEVFESHLIPYKRNPQQRFDDAEQLHLF